MISVKKTHEPSDARIVGLFEDVKNDVLAQFNKLGKNTFEPIYNQPKVKELGTITKIHTLGLIDTKKLVIVGLGKKADLNAEALKTAVAKAFEAEGLNEVFVDTFVGVLGKKETAELLAERVVYATYTFDRFKSKKKEKKQTFHFVTNDNVEKEVYQGTVIGESINHTRDLVNTPHNYLSTYELVDYTRKLVESLNSPKVKLRVLDKEEISALGMNAFLGVNQGSRQHARLIHLTYQGTENFENPLALVGKGVMFDTGGYNVKSTEGMRNMKSDMAGAASVLGAFEAAARLNVERNLMVIIAATDNLISSDAFVTDDILTAMNGKTIEIISTDAEGRLTLADALCYAQKEGAKELIDVATLTGAVLVALGDQVTGAFGNNQAMMDTFLQVGKNSGEWFWQLPITPHMEKKVRGSKVADLLNSTGRLMGSSGAAAFLKEFVDADAKWVHLDIAGTASDTEGATGAVVKTLFNYTRR